MDSVHWHRFSATVRHIAKTGMFAALIASCFVHFSCGGESETDKERTAYDKSLKAAEDAKSELEQAGTDKLFTIEFRKCNSSLEKAKEKAEEENLKSASSAAKKAARGFKRLIKKAKDSEEAMKEVLALKEEATEARKEATKKKTKEHAPRAFGDAEKHFKNCEKLAKDPKFLTRAKQICKLCKETYEEAIELASENAKLRDRAEAAREAMLAIKKQAKEAGAEKKAAQDWLYANREERKGNAGLKELNFHESLSSFESAETAYGQAIEQIQIADNIAKQIEEDQKRAEEQQKLLEAEASGQDNQDDQVEVDLEDDTSAADLDDTDSFLEENIENLALGIEDFDPITGEITLDYTIGPETFKKDYKAVSLKSKKYIGFWDPMMNKEAVESEPEMHLSFRGSDEGFVTLPVPLKAPLTVEWTTYLQVMDITGNMGPVIFSQSGNKKYWWVDFLTFRRIVAKRSPKAYKKKVHKKFKRSPNYWFNKGRKVDMRLEVQPYEKKDGHWLLSIFYDVGEDLGEKPLNKMVIKPDMGHGYVGWRWRRVKFMLRKLRVTGLLDKEIAMKTLMDKMGIEPPDPKATEEPVETGDTNKAQSSGDDPKKSSGKSVKSKKKRKKKRKKSTDDFDF